MDRVKMPREMRAKQFSPFDALKGLQEALRLKEYEHEMVTKGELSEEKIAEISAVLLNLNKNDIASIIYFCDGHNNHIVGKVKLDYSEKWIEINRVKVYFGDILNIEKQKI